VLFYNQYRTAKLTGKWPDDGWFLYLSRLVAEVERECQEAKMLDRMSAMLGPNTGNR
jgi:hypothetical protein